MSRWAAAAAQADPAQANPALTWGSFPCSALENTGPSPAVIAFYLVGDCDKMLFFY